MAVFDFIYLSAVGYHFYQFGFGERQTELRYMSTAMLPLILMAFNSAANEQVSKLHAFMLLFTCMFSDVNTVIVVRIIALRKIAIEWVMDK